MSRRKKVAWFAFVFFAALALGGLVGCQVDVSAGLGSKLFYPDSVGNSKLGDPRKPMYDGSGYVERHTAGGQSDFKGFGKIGGEK